MGPWALVDFPKKDAVVRQFYLLRPNPFPLPKSVVCKRVVSKKVVLVDVPCTEVSFLNNFWFFLRFGSLSRSLSPGGGTQTKCFP